ncbi:MAG: hypothetical protein P9L92_09035 [Candidatus Electryonea clarkiae]|nr:hypothetical protein [Candidatus Electryonea clarkiae]MDP8288696.1 hypothetical protein [Candidatus Electryonea clarkiae]
MRYQVISKLRKIGGLLKQRHGGLTMFELVISLFIITATSVAVASSFYTANGELNRQRRRTVANQLLKAEAEFWKGRIHSAFPSPFEMQHPIPNPNNPIPLDPDVTGMHRTYAEVWKKSIRAVDVPQTALRPDWYEIVVSVEYDEEPVDGVIQFTGRHPKPKTVYLELVVPFLPSSI